MPHMMPHYSLHMMPQYFATLQLTEKDYYYAVSLLMMLHH